MQSSESKYTQYPADEQTLREAAELHARMPEIQRQLEAFRRANRDYLRDGPTILRVARKIGDLESAVPGESDQERKIRLEQMESLKGMLRRSAEGAAAEYYKTLR